MNETISELVVGLLVTVLGLVGLVLVAGAIDDGIYVYGLGLAAFAVLFNIGLVRAHFDRSDAVKVRAP